MRSLRLSVFVMMAIALLSLGYSRTPLFPADDRIISFVADPVKDSIGFFWKDSQGERIGSLQQLRDFLQQQHKTLLFATNGGMYRPDHTPLGLFIQQGKTITPVNRSKGTGNFFLQPNGVFYITPAGKARICATTDFNTATPIQWATQSGPMLLINGQFHPAFKKGSVNLNIRSGVGILPGNQLLFAMSKVPVNFYDFATFFKNRGCQNALYLDGFVSRTYLPQQEWEQLDGDFGVIIGVLAPGE